MILLFFVVLSSCHWSTQHLTYPINYCNMASVCIHDNRVVCGSTPDGCSRRRFLDQCDMYEYNCDYGTRYSETYILYCTWPSLDPSLIEKPNGFTGSTNMESTHSSTTEFVKTKSAEATVCCNRPETWETTTEPVIDVSKRLMNFESDITKMSSETTTVSKLSSKEGKMLTSKPRTFYFQLDLCDPGADHELSTTDIVIISTTEKPIQGDDYLSVEELKL
ncbi:uncharacterized protein LOC115451598, partial [Manduca sexta]|uniref:uncharacterized protein LOC115451598 n=1 Tax=Manduca sexta TaxID=7130 RepID=UPI00188DCDDC